MLLARLVLRIGCDLGRGRPAGQEAQRLGGRRARALSYSLAHEDVPVSA
jgi:hypothetical protein